VYGNWGTSGVQRGDQWATTSHATNYATGTTTRTAQTSQGGAAASRTGAAGTSFAGRTASGDLYAGHDGNVYKNTNGSWQKYGNGGFSNVQPSGQLNNDWRARGEGETRSSEFSRLRSGGGWGSGSFRPSGGGSRGFGRRR
jgi:hypothetical protein